MTAFLLHLIEYSSGSSRKKQGKLNERKARKIRCHFERHLGLSAMKCFHYFSQFFFSTGNYFCLNFISVCVQAAPRMSDLISTHDGIYV